MTLQMKSLIEGTTARVTLAGQLDGASAPSLRNEVEQIVGEKPERLILEMEDLTFMASAGLRIIIFAKQRLPNRKVYIIKPQNAIVETLKKTGFYDSVYIQDTDPMDGR
jgi:anti-anti-sigma factor